RDVVGQRCEWYLHRNDVKPPRLEERNHFRPARSVGPCAVYEHNVGDATILLLLIRCVCCGCGCEQCDRQNRGPQTLERHRMFHLHLQFSSTTVLARRRQWLPLSHESRDLPLVLLNEVEQVAIDDAWLDRPWPRRSCATTLKPFCSRNSIWPSHMS